MRHFVLRCPTSLNLLARSGGPAAWCRSGGTIASGADLCREGQGFPRLRHLHGIHTEAIKEAYPAEEEGVEDPLMAQNSEMIIQRYRKFIEERRGEGNGPVGSSSRREMYDPLGFPSEVWPEFGPEGGPELRPEAGVETAAKTAAQNAAKTAAQNAAKTAAQNAAKTAAQNAAKIAAQDAAQPAANPTDQKYVILKKQISKEFIHQVFLPHVESQIMYHLKTYTPNQIVNIFKIYSYLYYYDKKKEMVSALLDYLEYRLDCFSVQDVLLVLEPLYLLNRTNNFNIYRLIINHLHRVREKMNLYNYIGVSRVFTKILIDLTFEEKEMRGKNILSRLFYHLKQRKYRKGIPPEQRRISHWDFLVRFMADVVEHVEGQLRLLSAIELTDLLSVMANYSFSSGYSRYEVALLGQESGMDTPQCGSPPSGRSTQHGSEACRHPPLNVHTLSSQNSYLFKENIVSFLITREVKSKYQDLSTLHRITNFHNLTKLFIYDEEYLQMIEEDLRNYHYISNIHHRYLSLLVWCLFKYRRLEKHIAQLKPVILHNIHHFNAKDLSRLCHAIRDDNQTLINIANNLVSQIETMSVNDFLCYFYVVVCLDLLPYGGGSGSARRGQQGEGEHPSKEQSDSGERRDNLGQRRDTPVDTDSHTLSLFNKSTILQKCTKYINENKKNLGKNEMTKIVLLLKRKKGGQYLYVLDLLPEEWKGILHLVN
ncbi:hypothetical protein C922_04892 [Plasmodium inui San Antonio 1]|uniref:Uncharacterized protein n=1 Tax=Plasmodium inui San Antonio 1 TaxID=1237626 RepID=W6ZZQ0_9APIC|nr:hypothetical protein C922_04892 [Plasmodium inui San Antonio 1]EUD64748.1 hypothetical protein C922_04892 [Plasmodium inui San Antonio 1]